MKYCYFSFDARWFSKKQRFKSEKGNHEDRTNTLRLSHTDGEFEFNNNVQPFFILIFILLESKCYWAPLFPKHTRKQKNRRKENTHSGCLLLRLKLALPFPLRIGCNCNIFHFKIIFHLEMNPKKRTHEKNWRNMQIFTHLIVCAVCAE